MSQIILFDLDGTLADLTHRLPFIQQPPKNWNAFFDAVYGDEPIVPMVSMLRLLRELSSVGICSGRPERCRADTERWLLDKADIGLTLPKMWMRKDGDFRADDIVKREVLESIRAEGWMPWFVFDDRSRVVKMWRDEGILCAQVAEGDF